jgi:hypothetical protein
MNKLAHLEESLRNDIVRVANEKLAKLAGKTSQDEISNMDLALLGGGAGGATGVALTKLSPELMAKMPSLGISDAMMRNMANAHLVMEDFRGAANVARAQPTVRAGSRIGKAGLIGAGAALAAPAIYNALS